MLTEDVCVDLLFVDVKYFRKSRAKSDGIEKSARTDDLTFGKSRYFKKINNFFIAFTSKPCYNNLNG